MLYLGFSKTEHRLILSRESRESRESAIFFFNFPEYIYLIPHIVYCQECLLYTYFTGLKILFLMAEHNTMTLIQMKDKIYYSYRSKTEKSVRQGRTLGTADCS